MNSKLRMIINHYGIEKQLKYFQSEVFELNEAIIDQQKDSWTDLFNIVYNAVHDKLADVFSTPKATDTRKEHIKEEIADVMVMLKQFQLYYDIPSDEIKDVMKSKIDRQLTRISEEVKKND